MLVTQLRPRGQRGPEEQAGGRPPGRHKAPGGRHQDRGRDRASGRAVPLHVQQGVGGAGHGGDAEHRRVSPLFLARAAPEVDCTLGFDYASCRTDIGWEPGETRLRGPAQRGDRQYLIWVMPAQGHAKSKSREPLARSRRLHAFGAHAGIPNGRVQWTPHW